MIFARQPPVLLVVWIDNGTPWPTSTNVISIRPGEDKIITKSTMVGRAPTDAYRLSTGVNVRRGTRRLTPDSLAEVQRIADRTVPIRNPRAEKTEWESRARSIMATRGESRRLEKQYGLIVDRATKVYNDLSPEAQAVVGLLEERFHGGDTSGFVAWARANVPGAFPDPTPEDHDTRTPTIVTPVEDLDGLPDRVYHGSRDLPAVLVEGLRLPAAITLANENYAWRAKRHRDGWPINWAPHVKSWWSNLKPASKASLRRQTGSSLRSTDDLGDALSLFWCSDSPYLAGLYTQGVEPVLEFDPRRMPIFGFFEPDEAGKGEIVLVLPSGQWQGGPDAITGVWER